jgi:hypothetical protein
MAHMTGHNADFKCCCIAVEVEVEVEVVDGPGWWSKLQTRYRRPHEKRPLDGAFVA